MTHSTELNELAAALAKAQGAVKGAVKDSANPFFKSKYADLSSVWEACRGPLSSNGLSVVQTCGAADGQVRISTMLLHVSGQWIADDLLLTPKEDSPQAIGSVLTYGRRYSLASIAGVAPEDDDAEAAEGRRGGVQKSVPVEPAGYDEFVLSLEAAAVEGTDALKAAFKESKPEYRDYRTRHDTTRHEALKRRSLGKGAA